MRYLVMRIIIMGICFLPSVGFPYSLHVRNMPIIDLLQMLAPRLHKNILINPQIEGMVTLHINHVPIDKLFKIILRVHGLASWQMGPLLYIGYKKELTERAEEYVKWRDVKSVVEETKFRVIQIKYHLASKMGDLLKTRHPALLSKAGTLQVDARSNSIVIADKTTNVDRVIELIHQLDKRIPQIMIEARIVSIDKDSERELGFSFNKRISAVHQKSYTENQTNAGQFSIIIAKLADQALLDIKLAALERNGRAELISTPSLFTSNLETASIEAGEEVPYQEVSESGGTAVMFKKAVLALKVTPHLLPGRRILLQLKVNQDRPSNKMILGVPTISTRQITTQVIAPDRQTIILGGIFETNREHGRQRVPLLSRIPFLNILFKQSQKKQSKRELLVFLTPRIT